MDERSKQLTEEIEQRMDALGIGRGAALIAPHHVDKLLGFRRGWVNKHYDLFDVHRVEGLRRVSRQSVIDYYIRTRSTEAA